MCWMDTVRCGGGGGGGGGGVGGGGGGKTLIHKMGINRRVFFMNPSLIATKKEYFVHHTLTILVWKSMNN